MTIQSQCTQAILPLQEHGHKLALLLTVLSSNSPFINAWNEPCEPSERFCGLATDAHSIADHKVYGTAGLVHGSGYLFCPDRTWEGTLLSYKESALLLFGRCDMADAASTPSAALAAIGTVITYASANYGPLLPELHPNPSGKSRCVRLAPASSCRTPGVARVLEVLSC